MALKLFFGNPSAAAPPSQRLRYLDTTSSGGDGTTAATSGAHAAYASQAALIAGEAGDLTAANEYLRILGTGVDTTVADWSGFTTDSTHYILFDGQDSYTHLTTSYGASIAVNTKNITFTRMIVGRNTAATDIRCLDINVGNVTFDKCTIYHGTSITLDSGTGMVNIDGSASGETTIFRNCVLYNALRKGIYVTIEAGATYTFENCTIDGSETDNFYLESNTSVGAAVNIRNMLLTNKGSGSDYSVSAGSATLTTQTNGTSDATSPQAGLRSLSVVYTNASAGDFTLVSGGAIDAGTDLSGSFTDDRAGNLRGATWELGANEYVSAGYTISAAQGSFTLTGQAAALTVQRKIVAAQGSFTLTGQTVALKFGHVLAAAQGSFSLTGQSVTLSAQRKITAAQGSFALTGQAVALQYSRIMAAAQGSFTLTGQAVAFWRGVSLSAGQGSFTLSGQSVALSAQRKITAAQGSFSLSGQTVILTAQRKLTAAQGSFALTGQNVTLTYAPSNNYTLTAAVGTFSLSGQATGLRAARKITAAQGSFALSGQAATLKAGRKITAAKGDFVLTGQDAALLWAQRMVASPGSFSLTGQDIAFLRGRLLAAASGAYSLTGQDLAFIRSYAMAAGFGSFTLTGFDADLSRTINSEARVSGTGRARSLESEGLGQRVGASGPAAVRVLSGKRSGRSGAGAARRREGIGE